MGAIEGTTTTAEGIAVTTTAEGDSEILTGTLLGDLYNNNIYYYYKK